jgi:Rps23 Pro-64 3,4-dihydroxylase Tpa1-like proline 4-hydroxylase
VLQDGTVAQYRKNWLSMEMRVTPLIRRLYWELNAAGFIGFLEQLTGIEGLVPDPYFAGGGLHETQSGGLLMVHADYNKHPELNLDRRLNLIIYLNEDWHDEYGGHLELWDRGLTRCEKKIAPVAGRAVIFSTKRDSWHGHPHPLACPEGMSRKSIALYYYTNGRPQEEGTDAHLTLWKKVPGQKVPGQRTAHDGEG